MIKETKNTNPTFNTFVDEAFMNVFNGLITGGTTGMKSALSVYIQIATCIVANGGFSKEMK
jgi:hypothetical protein